MTSHGRAITDHRKQLKLKKQKSLYKVLMPTCSIKSPYKFLWAYGSIYASLVGTGLMASRLGMSWTRSEYNLAAQGSGNEARVLGHGCNSNHILL